jgi:hypothetical protein
VTEKTKDLDNMTDSLECQNQEGRTLVFRNVRFITEHENPRDALNMVADSDGDSFIIKDCVLISRGIMSDGELDDMFRIITQKSMARLLKECGTEILSLKKETS